MDLLVDIGNSRVKWATYVAGTLGPQTAADHAAWGQSQWERELERVRPARVIASCVGEPGAREALAAASRRVIGRDPEIAAATAEAAGVRNGYANPAQLGVDRWLAIIGAFHRHRAPCCVVDVGTALTVDTVDASGRHCGGFIVPGPGLMARSLLAGTSDLADRWSWDSAPDPTGFPANTRDAIEHGCLIALAGLIEFAFSRLATRTGQVPQLVLTGGASPVLIPWLRPPAEVVPDLVLQGLARLT